MPNEMPFMWESIKPCELDYICILNKDWINKMDAANKYIGDGQKDI